MSRMSARFVGNRFAMDAKWVYKIWQEMGLVTKDKFGDWVLTVAGRNNGGRMSSGNYLSVPTFESETIVKMMKDFLSKRK